MKVAVTGWYGNDNVGDELLAAATIEALRWSLPSPEITLLTLKETTDSGVACCAPLFLGGASAARKALNVARHAVRTRGRWLRLATSLDLVVVGGGSLFHDRQPENIRLWKETLGLYRELGSSIVLYGVTVDHVRDPASRREQQELLRLADVVTVRDRESARWVDELSGRERAVLAADPVLSSSLLPGSVPIRSCSVPKRIGFNIRPLSGVSDLDLVREATRLVKALIGRFDGSVVFIPMWPGDVALGHGIRDCLNAGDHYEVLPHDPTRLGAHVSAYRKLDVVVGMRLHTLEIAAMHGLPVVGLEYDPKVAAFLDEISLGDYCRRVSRADGSEFRGFASGDLVRLVETLLGQWGEMGSRVRSRIDELRHREARSSAALKAWYDARADEGPRAAGCAQRSLPRP